MIVFGTIMTFWFLLSMYRTRAEVMKKRLGNMYLFDEAGIIIGGFFTFLSLLVFLLDYVIPQLCFRY